MGSGDKMNDTLNVAQDDFFDETLLFEKTDFIDLDDEDDFSSSDLSQDISKLEDNEFDDFLEKLVTSPAEDTELPYPKVLDSNADLTEERKAFEIEKELAYEKIRLEKEQLEQDKAKFARYKDEWESLKKLSEASFQAEKDEYEKQKQLEKEKRDLETKEIINSCVNFKQFLEKYKQIHDVSK